MFKETEQGETQYCPMCLEWSEKYKRLQAENEELKKENKENLHYLACMTEQRNKLKLALEEIRNLAELEAMLDKNSKAFYPANIQRILDVINEVLKDE